MVRTAVLALVCWFAVSAPAIVIIGKLIGAISAEPKPPTAPAGDAQARDLERQRS